jgi:hypothetical protein
MVEVRKGTDNMKEFNKVLAADGRWQFINKEYFENFYGQLRKWRGHLVLTAEAQALSSQASEEERDLYGHLGVKPKGQGRLHHICHTNLLLVKRGHQQWTATTIKDRNRTEMERMTVNDFALDYLKGVAGWKVKITQDADTAPGED